MVPDDHAESGISVNAVAPQTDSIEALDFDISCRVHNLLTGRCENPADYIITMNCCDFTSFSCHRCEIFMSNKGDMIVIRCSGCKTVTHGYRNSIRHIRPIR